MYKGREWVQDLPRGLPGHFRRNTWLWPTGLGGALGLRASELGVWSIVWPLLRPRASGLKLLPLGFRSNVSGFRNLAGEAGGGLHPDLGYVLQRAKEVCGKPILAVLGWFPSSFNTVEADKLACKRSFGSRSPNHAESCRLS